MALGVRSQQALYAQARTELLSQIYPSLSVLCSSDYVDSTTWANRLREANEHATILTDAAEQNAAILKLAVDAIRIFSEAHEFDLLFKILHVLSDHSRSEIWRGPFGSCGIVNVCVQLLNTAAIDSAFPWLVESTRLLGNCCVAPYESTRSEEVDDRAQEIESYKIREEVALRLQFSQVIPRLKIPVMHKVTLAFLYNLCADDDKLQASVVQQGLRHWIIELLIEFDTIESEYIVLCCSMARWIGAQGFKDSYPPKTLQTLLDLQQRRGLSMGCEVAIVATICAALESDPERGQIEIMRLLTLYKHTFQSQEKLDAYEATRDDEDPPASEISSTLMTALCELVNQDAFIPSTGLIHILSSWLVGKRDDICRCSLEILATLACKSEDVALTILAAPPIAGQTVSAAIVDIVSNTTESAVFRSVFRLVQNSARSAAARQILGDAGLLEASSRCWLQELNKQLHLSAVIQTKRLLRDSLGNIHRLITQPQPPKPTTFHSMLDKFTSTEDSDVRTQIGLTFCEVCVILYGENEPDAQQAGKPLQPLIHPTPNQTVLDSAAGGSKNLDNLQRVTCTPNLEEVRSAMNGTFHLHRLSITKPLLALAKHPNPEFAKQAWGTILVICRREEVLAAVYAGVLTKEGTDMFRALRSQTNADAKSQACAVFVLRALEAYAARNGTELPIDLRTILLEFELTFPSTPSSDT